MNAEEFFNYLLKNGIDSDTAAILRDEEVDESSITDINEEDLRQINIKLGPRKKVLRIVERFKKSESDFGYESAQQSSSTDHRNTPIVISNVVSLDRKTPTVAIDPLLPETTPISTTEAIPRLQEDRHVPAKSNIRKQRTPNLDTSQSTASRVPSFSTSMDIEAALVRCAKMDSFTYNPDRNLQPVLQRTVEGKSLLEKLLLGENLTHRANISFNRIIVNDLIESCGFYPRAIDKENCAKAIIKNFPQLQQSSHPDLPLYAVWYHSRGSTNRTKAAGKIEYRLENLRLKLGMSEKRTPKAKKNNGTNKTSPKEDESTKEDEGDTPIDLPLYVMINSAESEAEIKHECLSGDEY